VHAAHRVAEDEDGFVLGFAKGGVVQAQLRQGFAAFEGEVGNAPFVFLRRWVIGRKSGDEGEQQKQSA